MKDNNNIFLDNQKRFIVLVELILLHYIERERDRNYNSVSVARAIEMTKQLKKRGWGRSKKHTESAMSNHVVGILEVCECKSSTTIPPPPPPPPPNIPLLLYLHLKY